MFSKLRYCQWVSCYGTVPEADAHIMRENSHAMTNPPLISIVMPTYNSNLDWLDEAIKSVQLQLYPHWELCIADDCSTNPGVRALIEKYRQADPRIKVLYREENGHISAASNSALTLATGTWIALMDHDDLLSKDALYWVADAINASPSACLVYSDEDKRTKDGDRFAPYFKCDWNLDLFYSQNMFNHLGVFKKSLIDAVGGFRLGFEGAQDYDLVLRCIEQVSSNQIVHIPRVLYHWRAHAESVSINPLSKPYAYPAAKRALTEHLKRQGIRAEVKDVPCGMRIQYDLPENPPLVSLIIPTRNNLKLIKGCITSITNKTTYPHYEILIVDNGSDDPEVFRYFESLSSDSRIQIIRDDRPFNHSQLNNSTAALAKGELLGLLNDDLKVISPDWLTEMVSQAIQSAVGAVGAKLLYPNNTLQHAGVILGIHGSADHSCKNFPRNYAGHWGRHALVSSFSAVTAACLVIKKAIFDEVDGFDEKNLPIIFNDVDFCLRVRALGYRNVYTPFAELYHFESVSRGYTHVPDEQAVSYMKAKWSDIIKADPAYSPNFCLTFGDFTMASHSRLAPVSIKSPIPSTDTIDSVME